MRRILAVFLAAVMLLAACGIAGAEKETRKMETAPDADAFIEAFLGENPEEMDGMWAFSPQMEAALNQYGGIGGLAKQFAPLGKPEKIDPAYEGEIQGYKAFYIPVVFSAMSSDLILVVTDGAIAGLMTGAYSGGKKEEMAENDLFDSIELALEVESLGELPGILTVPKGEGPFPAVVLIHGSGSSDKDETVGSLKPFKDLAEGLAARGIAVYRFDKRSYVFGLMIAADKHFTLENESIEDAVNAVQMLAAQEKIDPERIYVLGHSLGGNAIPAIARELETKPAGACGFIMLAASPRPLDKLMREQYEFLYSLMPEITEEQQAEKDQTFAELDRLENAGGKGSDLRGVGQAGRFGRAGGRRHGARRMVRLLEVACGIRHPCGGGGDPAARAAAAGRRRLPGYDGRLCDLERETRRKRELDDDLLSGTDSLLRSRKESGGRRSLHPRRKRE